MASAFLRHHPHIMPPLSRYELQNPALNTYSYDLHSSMHPKGASATKSRHRAVRVFASSSNLRSTVSLYSHFSVPPPASSLPSLPPSKISAIIPDSGSSRSYEKSPQIPRAPIKFKRGTHFQIPEQLRRMRSYDTLPTRQFGPTPTNISTPSRSNFGLDRTGEDPSAPSIPQENAPDNATITCTPLVVDAETDSETSSLHETSQLEFPHPPDQTRELFLPEDIALTDLNEYCIDAAFRKFLPTSLDRSFPRGSWDLSPDTDAHFTNLRYDLEHAGEELLLDGKDYLSYLPKNTGPLMLNQGPIHANGFNRLLHTRSASSIVPRRASHTNNKFLCPSRPNVVLNKPSPNCPDSPKHSEPSFCNIHSIDCGTIKNSTKPNLTAHKRPPELKAPFLASAGRQRPKHRAHLSVPLARLGLPGTGNSTNPDSLVSPFHHRVGEIQPKNYAPSKKQVGVPTPTSFMDITPERQSHGPSSNHKEKMRRLLARASGNIISWGKTFKLTSTTREKQPMNGIN